jgi:hypothetical protein
MDKWEFLGKLKKEKYNISSTMIDLGGLSKRN